MIRLQLKFFSPIGLLALAGLSLNSWSLCSDSLPRSTPDKQFLVTTPAPNNPIVEDTFTGLLWMRCTLGQGWDSANNQCLNTNSRSFFTWNQALNAAKTSSYGGLNNWRLPNKKELASLLDLSCSDPAINTALFPDTYSARYWTSTPTPYSDSFYAWYIDFITGGYGNIGADTPLAVRLVRDKN